MAISATLTLNNVQIVATTPSQFQLYFNLNVFSSTNVIKYKQYVDGVVLGVDQNIAPADQSTTYSTITYPFYAYGLGFHLFETEVFNAGGESIRVGSNNFLDLTNPVLNNFALNRIDRNTSNDYVVIFDIDLSDDSGISTTTIENLSNSTQSQVVIPASTQDYRAQQSIVVPSSFNNVTHQFDLIYADYSGNSVRTSVPINVFLTNTPPTISNLKVTQIVQTSTDYQITVELTTLFNAFQDITSYSINYENPAPNYNAINILNSPGVITHVLTVPKTEPAGIKTIYGTVRDNYLNESVTQSITFDLDKLNPVGNVNLDYAEKTGSNYYANIHFTASDAGQIAAYSHNFVSASAPNWNVLSSPTQIFDKYETINLGPNGQKIMYVQYRDFSGNLSPVYDLTINIDNINPDCNFSFDRGELRSDNDYNAYFNLIASDDTSVKYIKLYGINRNSGNIISGQSDSWVRLTSSNTNYSEIKSIVVPASETEHRLTFYFQVKDLFGNESPIRATNVLFDKTAPVLNTFTYSDAIKTSNNYRIFADFNATDAKGIVAYRIGFDDITTQSWVNVTKTTSLDKNVYLDIPISEVGVSKNFLVQVKDLFGNYSNIGTIPIQVDQQAPTGSIQFVGGGLTANSFTLDFQLTGTDPNDNVYWYSLETDDSTIINWKKITTPNTSISEVQQVLLPRTSTGRHDFYLRLADIYKNVSPIYNLQYDLDSINTVGGIDLAGVEKTNSTYNANVALYAFDNRKVKSYKIDGGTEVAIVPPVQSFNKNLILPIGLSAGPKSFNVQYKDTFDNVSNTYYLNFNLDNQDPTANIYLSSISSDFTNYYMNFDLNMTDNQELYQYKFWYLGSSEPYTWSNIPRGQTSYTANTSFTVPRTDSYPGFKWKVKDFFDNEIQNTEYKTITTVPPTINSVNIANVVYSLGGSNVEVSYNVAAASGSTVDKLEVIVNEVGSANLDNYIIDIYPNIPNAVGTFYYNFPLTESNASFKIKAVSDYGYTSAQTVTTQAFESAGPVISNTQFLGSFADNSDYILQFKILGTDAASGIRTIKATLTTHPAQTVVSYTVPVTNNLDETINLRVDGTHTANLLDVKFELIDLLGNVSTASTLSNIALDRNAPTIANVVFNGNQTFNSSDYGANTPSVNVLFDSNDFSNITHYKYSSNYNEVYNSATSNTWSVLSTPAQTLSANDVVNLDTLGFVEGNSIFYIHVKDRFGNIGISGTNIEYDKTAPTLSTSFLNNIERVTLSGVENFAIHHNVTFTDNYSGVNYKDVVYEAGGTSYNTVRKTYPTYDTANNYTDILYVPVGNYGSTKVITTVTDRLQNVSANSNFNVVLENNAPTIVYTLINNGAQYTTSKDVFVRMSLTDDTGVTESLFSTTANKTWDSSGWTAIPFSPASSIISTFSLDLEALGFTEGTCNVYAFIKDACQNVANSAQTIIYDKTAPVVTDFAVNSITRGVNTYDIVLNAHSYDVTSGLDTYYISQNNSEKVYTAVPSAPVVGNTPVLFTETEQISVQDNGTKYFYFQATDAAGNVSLKANTSIYIDAIAPVAAYFKPTSTISKYYLNNSNNEFQYIVSDDYALKKLEYEIDNSSLTTIKTYDPANNITNDTNTFSATLSTLTDGEHTIYLTVSDSFENKVRVPHEFYYDNTAPTVSNFSIKEIRPITGLNNYSVEFNVNATDAVGISHYELYKNQTLVDTVPINAPSFLKTPTISVNLDQVDAAGIPNNLEISLMLIEDDQGVTISNAYALVGNYTGLAYQNTQIQNYLKNIIGIPANEINMFSNLGTNPEVIQQSGGAGSLSLDIQGLTYASFPSSYTIIQFYSATNNTPGVILPTTSATYIKNNYIYTVTDSSANPGITQFRNLWLTDKASNIRVNKQKFNFDLKVYDYAHNIGTANIVKDIHDGTHLNINNFTVSSATSISRVTPTSELFEASASSDVNVDEYALTIQSSIDHDSAFWKDFSTPNTTVTLSETVNTQNFAISTLSSNSVYLHVKDNSGNMANTGVDIIYTSNIPVIKSVNSPITLTRQGSYYNGELIFEIIDPDTQIEAYAIGFTDNPSNYKSLALTSASTITQQFKVPEEQIDGSKLVYLKLRDVNGNESLTYRISTRVLDFEFDKFEVIPDSHMVGNGNVRVLYDTDSNPTAFKYGYKVDDSNEPTNWITPSTINQNNIGEYYFDFNLDVSTISNGKHTVYVSLMSVEGEKLTKSATFISEQTAVKPYAFLSILKTSYDEGKKRVWVEANVFDDGVGVNKICFSEDSVADNFEDINIIQNKRIVKLFEYNASNNSTITYKLKLIDAVNVSSLVYNVSVDLSNVN